jgi:hypothetical protein
MWPDHPYKPKKAVTPTSTGRFVGRPPKQGSMADNLRKGIITIKNPAGDNSRSSSDGEELAAPPSGENELIMNLGSI